MTNQGLQSSDFSVEQPQATICRQSSAPAPKSVCAPSSFIISSPGHPFLSSSIDLIEHLLSYSSSTFSLSLFPSLPLPSSSFTNCRTQLPVVPCNCSSQSSFFIHGSTFAFSCLHHQSTAFLNRQNQHLRFDKPSPSPFSNIYIIPSTQTLSFLSFSKQSIANQP